MGFGIRRVAHRVGSEKKESRWKEHSDGRAERVSKEREHGEKKYAALGRKNPPF